MVGLRKVIKRENPPEKDVEAGSVAAPLLRHSPLFLAKAIGKKVFGLITVEEPEEGAEGAEGTSQSPVVSTIIFLRDVILGIISGVMVISVMVFLDHRDVIHMQSAHNFREAAFSLLNDPETIHTLEEVSDMLFMSMPDYEKRKGEIDEVLKELKDEEEKLASKSAEGEKITTELGPVKEEHDKLLANPALELDKFCGECQWNDKMTCEQHFQDLLGKNHLVGVSKFTVMFEENEKCKKE